MGDSAPKSANKHEVSEKYFKMLLDEPDPVQGVTVHTRYLPVPRSFQYPLYMWKFDCRYPPRAEGWGAYFRREDHFGDASLTLDACVRKELKKRLNYDVVGRIDVVCNLAFLGYDFNPITPYFAHDEFDHLVALLVEVHNTPWGERALYAMRVGEVGSMRHDKRDGEYSTLVPALHTKVMHVSPFNPPPKHDMQRKATLKTLEEEHAKMLREQSWYYQFKLKGKTHLTVEVFRHTPTPIAEALVPPAKPESDSSKGQGQEKGQDQDQDRSKLNNDGSNIFTYKENAPYTFNSPQWDVSTDERYITASWDITGLKEHGVHTGAIRTLVNVYIQALLMLLSQRFPIYWYQPSYAPLTSVKVWGWLLPVLPIYKLLVGRDACTSTIPNEQWTGYAVLAVSVCMAVLNFTRHTYFLLFWISAASAAFVSAMLFKSFTWFDCNVLFLGVSVAMFIYNLFHGTSLPAMYLFAFMVSLAVFLGIKREECEYPILGM